MTDIGQLNLSWRIRRFVDDYDHLYKVGRPTLLCTGEVPNEASMAHQLPDPRNKIVGYLHPPASPYAARKDIYDPALDTPINECPDCQNILTMMRLAE